MLQLKLEETRLKYPSVDLLVKLDLLIFLKGVSPTLQKSSSIQFRTDVVWKN